MPLDVTTIQKVEVVDTRKCSQCVGREYVHVVATQVRLKSDHDHRYNTQPYIFIKFYMANIIINVILDHFLQTSYSVLKSWLQTTACFDQRGYHQFSFRIAPLLLHIVLHLM
jgi:hypothetical protein